MSSRLIHYSDAELQALYSTPIEQINGRSGYKPKGLWVSVEGKDDWLNWCENETFHCGVIATEIKLAAKANILYLASAEDIDEFTEEFAGESLGAPWHRAINWKTVAARWHGIIIAPYCWERRLSDHTFWYYGWDCASGCIWDMDAVDGFTIL